MFNLQKKIRSINTKTIVVGPGTLSVQLETDFYGKNAVIREFSSTDTGRKGQIEIRQAVPCPSLNLNLDLRLHLSKWGKIKWLIKKI